MTEDWRLCLLKCSDELSSDINFDVDASAFIEKGILSTDQYSMLRSAILIHYRKSFYNIYLLYK